MLTMFRHPPLLRALNNLRISSIKDNRTTDALLSLVLRERQGPTTFISLVPGERSAMNPLVMPHNGTRMVFLSEKTTR